MRFSRRLVAVAAILGTAVGLAACDSPPAQEPVPPTFIAMTTDRISVTDPAAITDSGSDVLALNVFQRLMTAEPGAAVLKPDAARDCIFQATKVYVCTLREELTFHNGHPLTSSDVKFSIERAIRLNVRGSSASLLASLRKIETPDPLTIEFTLSRPDTQFGWAIAAPAASIVDEELYDPDEVRAPTKPIVGSGTFSVSKFSESELTLAKFLDYQGRTTSRNMGLILRTMPDSASIEQAIAANQVDVVWRGLDDEAVTRLGQQANGLARVPLAGVRVHQLLWNPDSTVGKRDDVRTAIRDVLQGDRSVDSVVPVGVAGHLPAFAVGGPAKTALPWSDRIPMTLGYDSSMPNGRALASQLRTRLEETGGLSVRLRPDDLGADLQLIDRRAWTSTAVAWLQPYLDAPPAKTATKVHAIEASYRASVEPPEATTLLGQLQTMAAADAVLLPLSQGDEVMFVRAGIDVDPMSFGPGWQLGMWGIKV